MAHTLKNSTYWFANKGDKGVDAVTETTGPKGHAGVDVGILVNLSKTIKHTDMVDAGATGTFTFDQSIPVGATVIEVVCKDVVKFDGDTSAVIIVGDGTDTNRYNTGTPNVFADNAYLSLGAISGQTYHDVAKAPVVTVTTNADFTSVSAGSLTLDIYYIK